MGKIHWVKRCACGARFTKDAGRVGQCINPACAGTIQYLKRKRQEQAAKGNRRYA